MSSLKQFINDKIGQLEHRRMMIPRYLERPEKFVGMKDFSMDDLSKIEEEIHECKAALWGINNYNNAPLPSGTVNEWIDVKERLPDISKDLANVLTYGDAIRELFYGLRWEDDDHPVFHDFNDNIYHVTHWQPLPPPPTKTK